jgi:hypothetical protein
MPWFQTMDETWLTRFNPPEPVPEHATFQDFAPFLISEAKRGRECFGVERLTKCLVQKTVDSVWTVPSMMKRQLLNGTSSLETCKISSLEVRLRGCFGHSGARGKEWWKQIGQMPSWAQPVLWKLAFFSTKCLRKTDATLQRDSFLPPWLLHVCPSILNTKTGDRQPPKRYLVTTVTHLQSNSVKVDQQTQSADKLCRKSHPTSMFGNSSAVQNRKFPLYPHVFPMIFPYFPYEIGHFGHLSARNTLSLPASTRLTEATVAVGLLGDPWTVQAVFLTIHVSLPEGINK